MASKSRQRLECASLLALLSVAPTPNAAPLAAGLRRLLRRKREQAPALQTLARIATRSLANAKTLNLTPVNRYQPEVSLNDYEHRV